MIHQHFNIQGSAGIKYSYTVELPDSLNGKHRWTFLDLSICICLCICICICSCFFVFVSPFAFGFRSITWQGFFPGSCYPQVISWGPGGRCSALWRPWPKHSRKDSDTKTTIIRLKYNLEILGSKYKLIINPFDDKSPNPGPHLLWFDSKINSMLFSINVYIFKW